ncbi:MAG: adenylosuccinate synthetase [Nitrospiraceae bacterium]|nr:adenylosuccinate synthetase [Nitrospiraceae bacterium]
MPDRIVLLSGHVGAGKTQLASELARKYGVRHLKTRDLIKVLRPHVESSRDAMQRAGEQLDRVTKGGWVREGLTKLMLQVGDDVIVVDAVRIPNQVRAVREAFGRRVLHLHLTAPIDVLSKRYLLRAKTDGFREFTTYDEVLANPTERKVDTLGQMADVVIDSNRCTINDVVTRAACHIGMYAREAARLVDVLVGGQYGSEGKGQIAAHVAGEYDVLVRVGGPNAGHTVFHKGGKAIFHHLPSGTVKSDAALVIGPGALLRVPNLLREIAEFEIEHTRLSIDPQAMIISDDDIEGEHGLKGRISSTGQGVGFATARKIVDRGKNSTKLARDIARLRPYLRETCEVLDAAFRNGQRVLLEGTQGTGLSIHHGSYPHVTSRDTTVAGCLADAGISPSRVRKVVMVCRTYPIRVADPKVRGRTSGPLQQISRNELSRRSGVAVAELRKTEKTTTTKRPRRFGEFDWVLLRKAASLNAPTDIALTFVDYLSIENRKARRFDQLLPESILYIEEIERVSGAPVSLISCEFGWVIDRRAW